MKTRNLFLSLFAFAALCACNKEAQPETPQGLENDAYVAVSIVAPSSVSTRVGTDGGFDAGEGVENAVSSAMFIFFNADGSFNQIVTPTLGFTQNETSDPFVEKISETTVILKAADITPTQMLVVLNAPSGLQAEVNGKTLTDVVGLAGDYSSETSFVMTNSVYKSTGVEASDITANIKKSATEAIDSPVTVYVERVLAKVTVNDASIKIYDAVGDQAESFPLALDALAEGVAPSGIDVKPVIKGYKLTKTAKNSYLYKNASGWNITDTWVWDAANFRSYWATSPSTEYTTYSYDDIVADPIVKTFYCQENTTSTVADKTSLIAAVQFVNAADNSNVPTFYKYAGDYYTADGIKAVAAQILKAAEITKDGAVESTNYYAASDIVIVKGTKGYTASFTVNTGENAQITAANARLASDMDDVWEWEDGQAYYYTNIEHFGKDASNNDLVGVVRNHVYQLTINSIKGFGVPVGGGDDIIVPETPTDEEFENLAATIKILHWKVVKQTVDFE